VYLEIAAGRTPVFRHPEGALVPVGDERGERPAERETGPVAA
jgi:hypothetical protein